MKLFSLALASLLSATVAAETFSLKSPDHKSEIVVNWENSQLSYQLKKNDKTLVGNSKIALETGKKYQLASNKITENDSTWTPVYGQFKTIRDRHNQLKLTFKSGNAEKVFLVRLFNDGLGMRFEATNSATSKGSFVCDYTFTKDALLYYHRGENAPANRVKITGKKVRGKIPFVIERSNLPYVAILESDIYAAKSFNTMSVSKAKTPNTLSAKSAFKSDSKKFVTPWRVILFADKPGELPLNTVAVNLATPCVLEDTSWITPGISLWDWRIHGYNNGDFVYGINTKSYLRMIDFAAKNGLEYLTVDDHWYTKAKNGTMTPSPEVDLKKVVEYGNAKGVKIILYYDRKKGNFGDQHLYKYYASLGVHGIKYGFMGNKVDFTRDAVETAAKYKLTMNFHDGPAPMTGLQRTLPNLVTREYCHAQQDSRKAFTPDSFLKMAVIEALTGPLDQANGNFGIDSINAGEREKGPKKTNTYISTVVSEAARCLVIFSGVVTYPDAPEEYQKKADLFEFMRRMPAAWDESVAVDSKMNDYITVARRSGKIWFLGSVNSEKPRTIETKLDFLQPGKTYVATIFADAKDADGVKNAEAYTISKKKVKKGDVLTAKMVRGGGYAVLLKEAK